MQKRRFIAPAPGPRIGAGSILSEAFSLYTTRFRAVMVPMLIIDAPILLLVGGVVAAVVAGARSPGMSSIDGVALLVIAWAVLAVVAVGSVFLSMPGTYAQYAALLYPRSTGRRALGFAFSRYGRALGAMFFAALPALGASLAGQVSSQALSLLFAILRSVFYAAETHIRGVYVAMAVWGTLCGLFAMALAYAAGSLACLTVPASASLDMTAGKALRYSISGVGPALVGHALACALIDLIVFGIVLIGGVSVGSIVLMGGLSEEVAIVLIASACAVAAVLALLAAPLRLAVNCAAFRLLRGEGQKSDTDIDTEIE